jgi:hypothetical protein
MSYTEVTARVAQIQSELAVLTSAPGSAASRSPASGSASFAAALAQAQSSGTVARAAGASLGAGAGLGMQEGSLASTLAPYETQASLPGSASVGAVGQGPLTPAQQQFAARLSDDTGLSPQVVSAWLLAEESGEAARGREGAANNDWLNIGYTDGGTYGSADSVWGDPVTAADATAGWLAGQSTIPGYGTASAGVQQILRTAGQSPEAQIAAIQQSGWASSGYPDLPALYTQIAG